MAYYFSKSVALAFDDAVEATIEALKQGGFGVLTDIDVKETLHAKLGVDVPRYRILGACNPAMAHKALQAENKVGAMLPCNVIVREAGSGTVEIAAVDPVASMQAVDNPKLSDIARDVGVRLRNIIDGLG